MTEELFEGRDGLISPDASESSVPGSAFRPSRRKVLTVAAWTVPVVIVGTAAPALAASSSPVELSWGNPCFHTSGTHANQLHLPIVFTNTYNSEIRVQIKQVAVNNQVVTVSDQTNGEVDPNQSRTVVVHVGPIASQPATVVITMSYTVTVQNGPTTTYKVTSPPLTVTACASSIV